MRVSPKPPDSFGRWKVRQHGAFSIHRDTLGPRPKDQSCHHEVWLYLAFVNHHGDSNREKGISNGFSSRKDLLHTNPARKEAKQVRTKANGRFRHNRPYVQHGSHVRVLLHNVVLALEKNHELNSYCEEGECDWAQCQRL